MDEEAILGGLRSGEDLPDFDYEDFEAGSTGQDRRGEDPGRDTPRGRGRYADDGDDRIFRQATDDEQARRAYSDRSGSESGHRRGHFDFVSMAMDMARPHLDDPEAMPIRPPRSLVPGESQVSDEFESRPQGPGTMVLVPGGIPGRSTGSQNPGQFDEHEERKFSDFGYDNLLKSTAGWGSSSKQGSDAGRPNPDTAKSESYDDEGYNFADEEESNSRRNAGSRATARTRPAAAKFEVDDDDEYAAFADRRDEEEDQPRRVARFRDAARPRSLSQGAARDLRVDRDARSERERARDSREVLRGLEAIHDREGPVGPPAIDDTPNVPPFPNITFGGPLNQRDVNSNRVTGSPRVTERAADVVGRGARDGRLADALGIEDRPSIASPLGRDTSDLETLRSSNEFTPQWNVVLLRRDRHPWPLRPIGRRRGGLAPHRWTQLRRMRRCLILLMSTSTLLPNLVRPMLIPVPAVAAEGVLLLAGHLGLVIVPWMNPEVMLELVGLLRGSRYRLLQHSGLILPVSQVTLGQRRCLICTSRRCSREVRFLAQSRRRSISLLTKSGY